MTTEPNVRVETENAAPFKPGDLVEHGAGVRIVVKACTLQVQHARTLWIIDGEDGNRYFAKNCKLVERHSQIHPGWKLRDDGTYLPRRWRVPFGGGYVEQRNPGEAYVLFYKDGTRYARVESDAVENLEEIQMEPEENTPGVTFEPTVAEAVAEVRKVHIELLRQQKIDAERALQDLVEEMKEHQAEFVRALASAKENLDLAEQEAEDFAERWESANKTSDGWRSVVVECEKILGMNGETPDDPKTSAVPMRVRQLVDALESSKKRRDEVIRILQGVKQ